MDKKLLAGLIFAISGGATYATLKLLKKKRQEIQNNKEEVEGP